MRVFKIHSVSNLQICNTVLWTIVTILYVTSCKRTKNIYSTGWVSLHSHEQHTWVPFFLVSQLLMNLPANADNPGSIPRSGRSPGEGNGNSLQYSFLF